MLNKSAKKTQIQKAIAMLLVFTLTFANWLTLGKVIATTIPETEKVKFDAYFEENSVKEHEIAPVIGQELTLNLDVEVNGGYLKDAKVYLNGLGKNYVIEEIESSCLELTQVNSGELLKKTLPIAYNAADTVELANLNSTSTVKITGTYVGTDGKEKQIEKEVEIKIDWQDESQITVTQEYTKYVESSINGQQVGILQSLITVKRNDEQVNLPIEETQVTVDVPQIGDKNLVKAYVSSINTSATNGKTLENVVINDNNDNEDKTKLIFKVNNEAKQGKVWSGKGQDEYLVTYIYEINANDKKEQDTIKITSNVAVNMKIYGKKDIITAALAEEKEVSKTEQVVGYELKTNVEEISKGKLYANQIKEDDKYEINYETQAIINIPYAKAVSNVTIEMPEDKLLNKEDETLNKKNISYYKTTKIAKSTFDKIIGTSEDGKTNYISILNGEKEIARIDGSQEADENGYYVIKYKENYENLQIKINNPISEGNLILINEKTINEKVAFTDEETVNLGKIETSLDTKTAQINLAEVESGITVEIDKTELSSIGVNKDVNIEIKLNNREENTLFYQEPVFDIILPEEVENIDVKQKDILYAEGLEIADVQKGKVGGKPALRVKLSGTQEEFSSGALSNGSKIVIKADITLQELSPNKEEKLQVKYQNSNPVSKLLGANLGETETKITLTAPEEVISIQTIKADDEGNEITSINEGKVAGKLEIFADAKTKQMELKVLNNYTVPVGNIVVLGRIPSAGSKSPEGIDLGSTFNTMLKTALTGSSKEATIYYSENAEATKQLDETWKTAENADLSKVKSYLIVFPEDYELAPAQSLTFTYDFEIPANLEHNAETYGAMTTSYNKIISESSKVAETSKAEFVGLSTGAGPQLKLELSANLEEGAVVREGQKIMYTAKVTNTGKNVAENVVVTVKETVTVTTTNNSITIGDIPVGETKEVTFEGTIGEIPSMEDYYILKGYIVDETGIYKEIIDTKKVPGTLISDSEFSIENEGYEDYEIKDFEIIDESTGKAIVTLTKTTKEYITQMPDIYSKFTVELSAKDLSKNMVSNTVSNLIKETKTQTSMNATVKENIAKLGEEFTYEISIIAKDDEEISNVQVEIPVINEIEYTKIEIQEINSKDWSNIKSTVIDTIEKINVSNGKVIVPISKLEEKKSYIVKIYAKVKENVQLEEVSKTVYNYANIYVANQLDASTQKVEVEITKDDIVITQECSNENYYIKPTEKATFTITIANNGILTTKVALKDAIPEVLKIEKVTKIYGASTIESYPENIVEETITLKPEETIVYKIETSLNYIAETEVGEITNIATINVNGVQINSNEVKLYAEYVQKPAEPENPNNPSNPSNPNEPNNPDEKGYKISGTAWFDENKNGQMETGEQKLSNIEVYLINEAGQTVQEASTNANGEYTFTNLKAGKYIVAFKYDNTVYNLTDYQKDGVSGSVNSDVIGKEGTAITDTIEIKDTSIGNINMGLVTKETFDLKLDKYVSKIVVQTASGTKEYTQKPETTLAKVEIRAKELKGAKVMMEYEIAVTNEGKTAGYAKEIVDYMPRDTEFSSELNSGWYLGSDGSLHTTQLKDILIQPGETKTLKVILSRNMTENNTDTVNNRAEIAKSHNQDLMEDTDSTAGNKANGEDDIGSADVIIGVATGTEVIYVTLAIISMIILGTGIYFIKRRVLER